MLEQADKKDTAALCIGMESSRYAGNCPGAQLDATRMAELLKKYSDDVTLLLSQQATKVVVVQKMQEVCQKDLAIIFYSGHGGDQRQNATTKQNWEEPTGKDQFLCLYDRQLLDDEIWSILCNAKGRVVLICDCCHSGTMFRAPMRFVEKSEETFSSGKEPSLWYLAGCPDPDYSYGDEKGGVLTNAFLEYFREERTYDRIWELLHNNKYVNTQEVVQHVEMGKTFGGYRIFR